MDKYALVQQKLDGFFNVKSSDKKTQKEQLKLLVSYDGKLRYELYGANNAFLGYNKIEDIFNLNFIEKAFVTYPKVEQTLLETINKIGKEQNDESKNIQLLLLPTKQYFALHKRQKTREINLNEIL